MKVAPAYVLALAGAMGLPIVTTGRAEAATSARPTEGHMSTREGNDVVDVPLKHTRVAIHVTGYLADVEVEQTFRNPYQKKINATYLFPLPAHAAVNDFDLETGGKRIEGRLQLRDQAKETYQLAVEKGKVAALLTEERPNLFTQSVGNLEPGAEVKVHLRFVEALPFADGGYELAFPLVAPARHVPASSKLTADEAAALQAPALPPGVRSSHDVEISVDVEGGVPIADLASPSHQIVTRGQHVDLAAGDTIPNKDFILRWRATGDKPQLAFLTHRQAKTADGSFYLLAEPPRTAAAADVSPREIIFVVDTSSSMRGKSLAKAKEVVRRTLGQLAPEDTFQIVRFDDDASALGTALVANKPHNVELALKWLDALDAGGGTDLATGVTAALALPHDPARLRIVAFLTDGWIGNEDEILAGIQKDIGQARLFSFGVGSAPNRWLLEEMAQVGRGTAQFVRPDEDTAAAADTFVRRIGQPVLTDVTIDWAGLKVKDVTPAVMPDLFVGQPLVVSGRYAGAGAATITVRGKAAGREVSFPLQVSLPEVDTSRPAVATVWARARIAELERQQLKGESYQAKAEIVGLALANRLVTRYTSFVAVDESHVTQGGKAETVAVPLMAPAEVDRDRGGTYGAEGGVTGASYGAAYGVGGGGTATLGVLKSVSAHGEAMQDVITATPAAPPPVEKLDTFKAGGDATREEELGKSAAKPADHKAKAPETVVITRSPSEQPAAPNKAAFRSDVMRCYKTALAARPHLAGVLTMHVVFAGDGTVARYQVTSLPGSDDKLNQCLDETVSGWKVAPTSKAREMDFEVPLAPGKE